MALVESYDDYYEDPDYVYDEILDEYVKIEGDESPELKYAMHNMGSWYAGDDECSEE